MKKRIWKRVGAAVLVGCMIVLNIAALLFPAGAEEPINLKAAVFDQYENLSIDEEKSLLAGLSAITGAMDYGETRND